MQSRSLIFLFVLVIAIPIFMISSNHEIFFTVSSIIILLLSVRYIFKQIKGESLEESEPDEDTASELEELIDIDVKRFGTGISVIANLLTILFLIYCSFYLDAFALKMICSLAILLQIHFVIKKLERSGVSFSPDRQRIQILLSSLLNIAVVIFTVLNKLSKLK